MSDAPGLTVADLLARARQGDASGRELLFAACRQYLAVVAAAHAPGGVQSKVDASDLVQQTLLEAHRDFARFEGRTTAEWLAWLRRILAHNAADAARHYRGTAKRSAGREVPLGSTGDDGPVGAPEPAALEPSPSQQVALHDRELRVVAALAQLSPDHQRVIVLRNLERLPFDEVASRMDRTRPAVQMLWMRAIRKLQEIVPE
jgi:RNA polymerase sigma-70 factor (ECF subfamily)